MSLDAFYQRYFPLLREKCRRLLFDADEAQDVAQETFIRLWRAGMEGSPPERVTAWVYRTATHLAIDRLRRRRFVAPRAEGDVLDEDGADRLRASRDDARTPEQLIGTRQLLAVLVEKLPEQELEVALLTRVDGLTQPEVAEVLGISERTVRRVLDRVDGRLDAWREELAR